jgi:S-adenosylmethionine:tRNA ribosyltransferase-isomerase
VSRPAPVSPLEAREPPEARAAGRADVALLVSRRHDGSLVHARFRELPRILGPGDLLVVNTSATLPAALPARLGRRALELHLSTPVGDGSWTVELRTADLLPLRRPPLGSRIDLPEGAHAELVAAYLGSHRLSVARLTLGVSVERYLARHGRPIRYRYLDGEWPIGAYQTVFALEPGSAEMPSAARPFTAEIVTELVARGVLVAPVTLHTGVSSLERGEHPYPERYRVPAATARLVNATREWGGRVIAVGTTVVRALETVAAPDGTIATAEGWTNHVVTPRDGLRAIDGLLTGWHDPESSHLELLKAAMGSELVERSYRAALAQGYLFHEFGDTHLILP